MKLAEILNKIEGLTRDKVYYFESQGFISSKRIKRGRIERREYTEEAYKKLKALWRYYEEGFPPKVAYEKAVKELRQTNLISLAGLPERLQKAVAEVVKKVKVRAALVIDPAGDQVTVLIKELSPGVDIELLPSTTKGASDTIRQKGHIARIKGKDIQADAAITQDEIVVHCLYRTIWRGRLMLNWYPKMVLSKVLLLDWVRQ